jgi:hypothetical protein
VRSEEVNRSPLAFEHPLVEEGKTAGLALQYDRSKALEKGWCIVESAQDQGVAIHIVPPQAIM